MFRSGEQHEQGRKSASNWHAGCLKSYIVEFQVEYANSCDQHEHQFYLKPFKKVKFFM